MNSHVLFILSLILSLCIFSSCKVVGYSDGFNHLSSKEKNNIQVPYSSIDSLKNNGKIYKINVGQLKQALNNKKDAIVYEFITFCTQEYCQNPSVLEKNLKKANCDLYVIATLYDNVFNFNVLNKPIFTIDNSLYNTRVRSKYEKVFFNELTGTTQKQRGWGSYHYFHKGKYITTFNDISDFFHYHKIEDWFLRPVQLYIYYSLLLPTLLENWPPCLSHENENMGGCFMFQAGASTRSEA